MKNDARSPGVQLERRLDTGILSAAQPRDVVNPVVKSIACRRATRLIDRRCVAHRPSKFSATIATLAATSQSRGNRPSYAQFTRALVIGCNSGWSDNVVGSAYCDERFCLDSV